MLLALQVQEFYFAAV